MSTNVKSHLFSWVRKGIANQISEEETLGKTNGSVMERPSVQLSAQLKATPVGNSSGSIESTQLKDFLIVGPGDVLSINSNAVMNYYPAPGNKNFPIKFKPYIEFWEPDFAWRYTPARATAKSGEEEGKLRPWIAVVACKKTDYSMSKNSNGISLVTFNVTEKSEHAKIFPDPGEIWKSAHAQGSDGSEAEFCRIIGINSENFTENTDYTAFVIPTFETTRLRALGCEDDLQNTEAQKSAWDKDYNPNTDRKFPYTFPVFYSWDFRTNEETFKDLVDALKTFSVDPSDAGINIDVTDLGDGLSRSCFKAGERPKTQVMMMPAATKIPNFKEEGIFPDAAKKDELKLHNNLISKLESNPVFQENKNLIEGGESDSDYDDEGNNDPKVVPPIYGGKHSMATSLENAPSWLKRINTDLHYRAAAGLGKKIIQEHQEQLVNRAWKQIEVVKALNGELYKRLLSSKVNDSIKNRNYKGVFNQSDLGNNAQNNEHFLQNLMMSLGSMKNTGKGDASGTSIQDVLKKRSFPATFADPTFQSKTQQLSSKLGNMDLSSLITNVSKNDFYKIPKPVDFNYFSMESLDFFAYQVLLHSRLFMRKLTKKPKGLNAGTEWKRGDKKTNGMKQWKIFNYLSIHKRAPQYIKWNALDYSNLKQLSDKVYKFRRKLNKFATDEQITYALNNGFDAERLLIKSRYDYFQRRKPSSDKKTTGEKKSWFSVLVDTFVNVAKYYAVLNFSPSYGSIYFLGNGRHKVIGNVIGLNNDTYCSLFGGYTRIATQATKYITRITSKATLGKEYYFVNRDKIVDEIMNGPEDSLYKKYIKLGAIIKDEFRDYEKVKKALNLFQPDVINICGFAFLDKKFKKNIYTIDSVYDWVSQYITNTKNGDDPTVQAYNKYKAYRKLVSENKDKLFPDEYPKDNTDLPKLEEHLDRNTHVACDRAQEVVENYFQVFLSEKGEEVRERFIEDCLNSKFPIMAYPQFPEPTYYYLKELSDKFILPCVDKLPDNTVTMFTSNEGFVESFLCGMNTEMGRELLWREYPTDQRGSYFKKFWDTETSMNDILDDNFFDIKSLHTWENNLGENHNPAKSQLLMFAIKGKLMKVYPDTQIFLQKAQIDKVKKEIKPIENGNEADTILKPVAQGFFKDDIYVVGFKISYKTALGSPNGDNQGYMLVFKQTMENLDFMANGNDKCKNAFEYAYNVNADQGGSGSDGSVANQAMVRPYMSAKHIFTYASTSGK